MKPSDEVTSPSSELQETGKSLAQRAAAVRKVEWPNTAHDNAGFPSGRELPAESITVRIRWFGLAVGYLLVNLGDRINASDRGSSPLELNAILTLGAVYAMIDTYRSIRGQVLLAEFRILISGGIVYWVVVLLRRRRQQSVSVLLLSVAAGVRDSTYTGTDICNIRPARP